MHSSYLHLTCFCCVFPPLTAIYVNADDAPSALMEAIKAKNSVVARDLANAASETQVNHVDPVLGTPLMASARFGLPEVARILLKNGAKPDTLVDRRSALYLAARHGRVDVAELLIAAGAKPNLCSVLQTADGRRIFGQTPLDAAAMQGSVKMVDLLVNAGASPNYKSGQKKSALFAAMLGPNSDSPDKLKQARQMIRHLVRLGCDPNEIVYRDTPLIVAVKRRNLIAVKAILEVCPDLDVDALPPQGATALYHAATMLCRKDSVMTREQKLLNQQRIVVILLDAGANPHKKIDHGRSPASDVTEKRISRLLSQH